MAGAASWGDNRQSADSRKSGVPYHHHVRGTYPHGNRGMTLSTQPAPIISVLVPT